MIYYISFGDTNSEIYKLKSNQSHPLVFPYQWVRSCLAVSTESDLVRWVVDGHLVEDIMVDSIRNASANRPTDITGNIVLGAGQGRPWRWGSEWYASSNKVTNLNIFSSLLPIERMVRMTSGGGEECGEGLLGLGGLSMDTPWAS